MFILLPGSANISLNGVKVIKLELTLYRLSVNVYWKKKMIRQTCWGRQQNGSVGEALLEQADSLSPIPESYAKVERKPLPKLFSDLHTHTHNSSLFVCFF